MHAVGVLPLAAVRAVVVEPDGSAAASLERELPQGDQRRELRAGGHGHVLAVGRHGGLDVEEGAALDHVDLRVERRSAALEVLRPDVGPGGERHNEHGGSGRQLRSAHRKPPEVTGRVRTSLREDYTRGIRGVPDFLWSMGCDGFGWAEDLRSTPHAGGCAPGYLCLDNRVRMSKNPGAQPPA
ncbi:MAG: hypothetical protein AVDCRST_MAG64-1936 [uncultured Phycisphaerae bacterium]|uniref:Uncharacterized protein n=1 Tax=uncultured Phycisphaerae bacterium TaxID=904963 RepID=A0A6J4P3L5_9BACT|nr:MAG: hypothetical protein AVDCRST_MAG64-1936 [uncultured Phycisphaerae bacterium]